MRLTESHIEGDTEDGDEKIPHKYDNSSEILKLYYHPVHFGVEEETGSPTALVPFCQFGPDMARTGRTSSHFDIPVCNIFREKIVSDQLCYQVDINKFQHNKSEHNRRRDFRDGLLLIIDVNEEYQTEDLRNLEDGLMEDKTISLKTNYVDLEEEHHFRIYIETISISIFPKRNSLKLIIRRLHSFEDHRAGSLRADQHQAGGGDQGTAGPGHGGQEVPELLPAPRLSDPTETGPDLQTLRLHPIWSDGRQSGQGELHSPSPALLIFLYSDLLETRTADVLA